MERHLMAGFWILVELASELRRIGTRMNGGAGADGYLESADEWAAVAAYRHTLGGWGHE